MWAGRAVASVPHHGCSRFLGTTGISVVSTPILIFAAIGRRTAVPVRCYRAVGTTGLTVAQVDAHACVAPPLEGCA